MKHIDQIASLFSGSEKSAAFPISGRWHNLQVRPDLGSGEILNIGVAFVDESELIHIRVAQDLSRLRCLYDDRIDIKSFEKLCSLIESAYNGSPWKEFNLTGLSKHAMITEGRYASGSSIGDILSTFFNLTVPLGRAIEKNSVARPVRARTISTETATENVIECLKIRMGQRAIPFIAKGPWTVHESDGTVHRVNVPIRASGTLCASVVSLWSKDEYRRKFQLAKAGLDLDTVQAHAPGERLGLFVMRPMEEEGYSKSELDQIDNEIDEAAWQLRKLANIEVEQSEDAEGLSDKLAGWLEAA